MNTRGLRQQTIEAVLKFGKASAEYGVMEHIGSQKELADAKHSVELTLQELINEIADSGPIW